MNGIVKITETPDLSQKVNIARIKNAQSAYQNQYNHVANSVTELSQGVPASLEPPSLNDKPSLVPRQYTASKAESIQPRPLDMHSVGSINEASEGLLSSNKHAKQKNSRRFDHVRGNNVRSESGLIPSDEEEKVKTLDDAYPRNTPSNRSTQSKKPK